MKFCATVKRLSRTNDALRRTCNDLKKSSSEINCVIVEDRWVKALYLNTIFFFTTHAPAVQTLCHGPDNNTHCFYFPQPDMSANVIYGISRFRGFGAGGPVRHGDECDWRQQLCGYARAQNVCRKLVYCSGVYCFFFNGGFKWGIYCFISAKPQHDVEMVAIVRNRFDTNWTSKDKRLCYLGFEMGYKPNYQYHYTTVSIALYPTT